MADEKQKKSGCGWVTQIIVPVMVALLVGGTAPWWWNEIRPRGPQPTPEMPTVASPSFTPQSLPAIPSRETPPQRNTPATQPFIPSTEVIQHNTATASVNLTGEYSVRPYVSPQDDHISPLIEVNSNFSNTPQHNTYNVFRAGGGPYIFGLYWCAADYTVLYQNLSYIDLVLLINERPISYNRLAYSSFPNPVNGTVCTGYTGIVSFTDKQEYRLKQIIRIREGLNDGSIEYPVGEYIEEYIITIQ